MIDKKLSQLFSYIDQHQDDYVTRLAEAVSMRSVGGSPHLRSECFKIVSWAKQNLEHLGGKVELFANPTKEKVSDEEEIDYPPVILATFGYDKGKKTICIFGHLDIQSAVRENDGWETDPFKLTEIDGKLYGRGATDDKGPVCAWLNCLEAYKQTGIELPVNVKLIIDCMEASETLENAIKANPSFFEDASYVCISDNYWLTTKKPCLTYGLRGIAYYALTVECAHRDLHSGIYGGAVHEAMWDLVAILDTLVDSNGKIAVPGLNELVAPLTAEEDKLYDSIEFCVDDYWHKETGASRLLHNVQADKKKLLQHRWRFPSLSIHGIEGDFSEAGAKTVIPRKVTAKFSIRLVPNQDPAEVDRLVQAHVTSEFAKRNSPNKFSVKLMTALAPWVADVKNMSYEVARRATKKVWGVEPDMTREGGTMPAALSFEALTSKKVIMLPFGQSDDGSHSNREKVSRQNYINGVKLFAALFEETALY